MSVEWNKNAIDCLVAVNLPSPPESVTGQGMGTNIIGVTWTKPKKNGNTVTGYKVFYSKDNTVKTKSVSVCNLFKQNRRYTEIVFNIMSCFCQGKKGVVYERRYKQLG